MYHIGIIALQGHCATVCLFKDGKVISAVSEERFSRVKEDNSFPIKSLRFLINSNNLDMKEIAQINYAWSPIQSLFNNFFRALASPSFLFQTRINGKMSRLDKFTTMLRARNIIKKNFSYSPKVKFWDHHKCHAASTLFHNDTKNGYSLVIDGAGERSTISFLKFENNKIKLLEDIKYPHSFGLFYSGVTKYLGFTPDLDEYKVMGLASYGEAKYTDNIIKLFNSNDVKLNLDFFAHHKSANYIFSNRVSKILPEPNTEKIKMDIAKSTQVVLEQKIIEYVDYLTNKYNINFEEKITFSGGVFQNCVLNQKIREHFQDHNLFFSPICSDLGTAIGAGMLYCLEKEQEIERIKSLYLGPDYSDQYIKDVISKNNLNSKKIESISDVAQLLAEGKIIATCRNKSELGPRALGNRSILADPRHKEMQDKLNIIIKNRESFRPFAPITKSSEADKFFDIKKSEDFKYMIETVNVKEEHQSNLRAITHIDGTARLQTISEEDNPFIYKLITEFEKITNYPVLVNTSFNRKNEPIVNSPEEAIDCFINTDIDYLILNNYLIQK